MWDNELGVFLVPYRGFGYLDPAIHCRGGGVVVIAVVSIVFVDDDNVRSLVSDKPVSHNTRRHR